MDYAALREQIYRPLREEGVFDWDWLYGQEYALAVPVAISRRELDDLRAATVRLGAIYARTTRVVQAGGDELLAELGLPPATYAAVRLPFMPAAPTLIGRFDFVRTPDGWKMLELNSDTPGGIVEAFYVNGKVCARHGAADPNAGLQALLPAAFGAAADHYRSCGHRLETIVFSALDWHLEDAGTTKYLLQASGLPAAFVPLKDLRVAGGSLCFPRDGDLVPVDLWYRLHPLGLLAEDRDSDNFPTGEALLALIAGRRLAAINPPCALIAQTKALQALIWALAEQGEFFSRPEADAIAAHMLPTYFENRLAGRRDYVVKPVLGREGGGIAIHAADGSLLCRDGEKYYWDQPMVYQQYQQLERVDLETLAGRRTGCLVWSCFLINGRAAAVGARMGGAITDDMAYFVPVCLTD